MKVPANFKWLYCLSLLGLFFSSYSGEEMAKAAMIIVLVLLSVGLEILEAIHRLELNQTEE
jgi:hypothetical protein